MRIKVGETISRKAVQRLILIVSLPSLIPTSAPAAPIVTRAVNAFGLRPFTSIHNGVARASLLAIIGDRLGPDDEIDAAARRDKIILDSEDSLTRALTAQEFQQL